MIRPPQPRGIERVVWLVVATFWTTIVAAFVAFLLVFVFVPLARGHHSEPHNCGIMAQTPQAV
jgi:hypothetical protein